MSPSPAAACGERTGSLGEPDPFRSSLYVAVLADVVVVVFCCCGVVVAVAITFRLHVLYVVIAVSFTIHYAHIMSLCFVIYSMYNI